MRHDALYGRRRYLPDRAQKFTIGRDHLAVNEFTSGIIGTLDRLECPLFVWTGKERGYVDSGLVSEFAYAVGDDEQVEYNDAALRVGASRWGALPALAPSGRLALRSEPGEPGQTCLLLGDAKAPLLRRCTFGTVWMSSARVHPDGRSAVVSVQPLDGWTELWVLRARAEGWTVDVLPPAASEPGLGYLEFAGWVPGGQKLLVAREARIDGRLRHSFEVLSLETLNTEKQASTPQLLHLFGQWQDARWKQQTVSLR